MYVCNYVYTGKISWNNLISSVPTEVKQLKNEVWVTVHLIKTKKLEEEIINMVEINVYMKPLCVAYNVQWINEWVLQQIYCKYNFLFYYGHIWRSRDLEHLTWRREERSRRRDKQIMQCLEGSWRAVSSLNSSYCNTCSWILC